MRPGLLPALVAVSLWGSSYAGLTSLQAIIPPVPLAAVRCLAAIGPLAVAVALSPRRPGTRPGPGDWGRIVMLGLAGNTLFQLGLVASLHYTSPAHSALIVTLSPLMASLLAWVWLGEGLRRPQVLGILVAAAGIILVITGSGAPSRGALLGDLLAGGAALSWAIYSVLGRPVVARYGALPVTLWTMVAGAVALLPVGLPGALAVPWSRLGLSEWALLGYLSLVTLSVANLCWFRALARLPTAQVVVCSHLTPLIATGLAAAAGQAPLTGQLVAGGAAVLVGVFLTQRGYERSRK
jgi:drug/metabolite transporter (DMT)-like permease